MRGDTTDLRRLRGRRAKQRAIGALVAGGMLVPLPALAQPGQAPAQTVILDPVSLFNESDMNFGQITRSGTAGTVVLTPVASPTCTTTGGLVHAGLCRSSAFSGIASFQANLRVQSPNGGQITLTGPGGATMVLDTFTFGSTGTTVYLGNNGNSPNHRFRVDAANGAFRFYVGGTLHVAANQAIGIYTGTYDIRITYN